MTIQVILIGEIKSIQHFELRFLTEGSVGVTLSLKNSQPHPYPGSGRCGYDVPDLAYQQSEDKHTHEPGRRHVQILHSVFGFRIFT